MNYHLHLRIDGIKRLLTRLHLRSIYITGTVNDLALEVRIINHIKINDANLANTGGCQIHGDRRPQPACTNAQHTGALQFLLPCHAHLRQNQVP